MMSHCYEWAENCGVWANKIELVLFTKKKKIPPFNTPMLGGRDVKSLERLIVNQD